MDIVGYYLEPVDLRAYRRINKRSYRVSKPEDWARSYLHIRKLPTGLSPRGILAALATGNCAHLSYDDYALIVRFLTPQHVIGVAIDISKGRIPNSYVDVLPLYKKVTDKFRYPRIGSAWWALIGRALNTLGSGKGVYRHLVSTEVKTLHRDDGRYEDVICICVWKSKPKRVPPAATEMTITYKVTDMLAMLDDNLFKIDETFFRCTCRR